MPLIVLFVLLLVLVFYLGRASRSEPSTFRVLSRFFNRVGRNVRSGFDRAREDWEDAEAEIREEAAAASEKAEPAPDGDGTENDNVETFTSNRSARSSNAS